MEDRKFEPTDAEPASMQQTETAAANPPAPAKARAPRKSATARRTGATPGKRAVAKAAATTKPAPKTKKSPARAPKGDTKTVAARPAGRPRFIVLFRHGLAEEHSMKKPDGERSLTTEGHEKTKRAARGLETLFPEADALYSSPLLRAMQTALWLAKAYGGKLKIEVTDALLPDADPAKLAALIASRPGRNVIVVGHEPHLTNAFDHFAGGNGSLRADLKKAGCIGIRLDAKGTGTLEWMLAPRMLRRID